MRAAASLLLVLAMLTPAHALADPDSPPAGLVDLIVLWRDDVVATADLPPGANPLSVVPGFVLPDSPPHLEALLRADPAVAHVERAVPLERHSLIEAGAQTPAPVRLEHRLTRAHEVEGLTGAGVTIAVVDSGIDPSHPDLAGRVRANLRLVEGQFVPSAGDLDGHGTHVAGLAAANGAASEGAYAGVAPRADLVGLDISGRFTTASAILAYDWLHEHRDEHDVRVVVNAWGRVDGREHFDPADATVRAIDRLVADGVVVLFSASNRGPAPATLSLEAQNPNVVTVGATDNAARLMSYSARGPVSPVRGDASWTKPDVVAPGERAVGPRSTQTAPRADDPDALHTTYSGTSQSVPHVAGIVALLLEARPGLTPAQVGDILRASAIDLGPPGPDPASGFGLVDVPDALRLARGLAAERTNVLAAGGDDAYEASGELLPQARRGLLGLPAGPAPQEVLVLPFPVKPDAQLLQVVLRASDAPLADVRVTLQPEEGRAITLEGDDLTVTDPAPGLWTLRVSATAADPTQVHATATVVLPPNATRALQVDGRQRAPAWDLSEDAPGRGSAGLYATARHLVGAHPATVPAFAAGILLALAALQPRRKTPTAAPHAPPPPPPPDGGDP